jgi:hypothetical protein
VNKALLDLMTLNNIERQIRALKALVQYYAYRIDKRGIQGSCPLCEVGESIQGHIYSRTFESYTKFFKAIEKVTTYDFHDKCTFCPWVWFKEIHCTKVVSDIGGYRGDRLDNESGEHQWWYNNRIRQIKSWIRKLEEYLIERKRK